MKRAIVFSLAAAAQAFDENFCDGKVDGTYPDVLDCSEFYQCSNGMTYHSSCPPGLEFNVATGGCDWAYNVDCDELEPTESPATTSESSSTEATTSTSSSTTTTSTTTSTTTTTTKSTITTSTTTATTTSSTITTTTTPETFCSGKTGIYADPETCNSFYSCGPVQDWFYAVCQGGNLFNSASLQCDLPENVDCDITTAAPTTTKSTTIATTTTEKPTTTTTEKTTTTKSTTTIEPVPTACEYAHKYNVIYMDYKINWSNITSDIVAAVDNCYTVINLSFWLYNSGFVDASLTFSQMSDSDRANALNYAHSRGAKNYALSWRCHRTYGRDTS
jgi:hypothetical protein